MQNNNIIRPNVREQIQTNTLQNSYIEHVNTGNRLSDRTPYDGMLDRFGEVRLRIAIIDNHEIKRPQYSKINPLDPKDVINLNTGNVTLRWVDMPGGIIRDKNMAGKWEHNKEYEDSNVDKHENIDENNTGSNAYAKGLPENRDYDEWIINSRREMVQLTHPFIWADSTNYCGMNYIPPVGSMVIVGFKKHGHPVILGYVPTHYAVCKPVLKPGEITMKGYGNNYIHWRQSDKLDMKVWAEEGKIDNDDYEKLKTNKANCTLWLRMNANDRYLTITAEGENPEDKNTYKTNFVVKPEGITMKTSSNNLNSADDSGEHNDEDTTISSTIEVNPESIVINTGSFRINAGNIELNASETMKNTANSIVNSAGSITTNAGTITSNSSGEHTITGSIIYIN